MKYGFIQSQAARYPIRLLCRVLGVSASGYYVWRKRCPSQRQQANQELLERIRRIHLASRRTYGSPRVYDDLREAGVPCSVNRVARLMRQYGITVQRKPRYVVTTESGGTWQPAPNLLARRFAPGAVPAWVADLTYVRTDEGVLYLAVVMNMYSRRVIGWSMGNTQTGALVQNALKMALDRTAPVAGQLHHSDRGGQYASNVYRALVKQHGMRQSMSRQGDCWDNAVVESFFATLKCELLYRQPVRTR